MLILTAFHSVDFVIKCIRSVHNIFPHDKTQEHYNFFKSVHVTPIFLASYTCIHLLYTPLSPLHFNRVIHEQLFDL